MSQCTSCGSPLESELVCESCGALQASAPSSPWAALGLELGYAVDPKALKKRLLALQRRMHPDFFGDASSQERQLAERNTAELNAAHRVLADDVRRADHLVRRLGGPDEKTERQMPQAFLMEVLEWNEELDEARAAPAGSPAREGLDRLESTLREQRARTLEQVGAGLDPLPDRGAAVLTEVRQQLNVVRYFDRTLQTLAELRLEQAKSTS